MTGDQNPVDILTGVAEEVKAAEQPPVKPEPSWNLSQMLRLMRECREGSVDGDEMLVTLMCKMLDIPSFEEAGRAAVRAQVLG